MLTFLLIFGGIVAGVFLTLSFILAAIHAAVAKGLGW